MLFRSLSNVGIYLNKQVPGFDVRNYNYKNMGQIIGAHKDMFDIKSKSNKDGIHQIVYVRLKTDDSAK